MDQNEAPLVDALAEYHRLERYGFTPPGHRQGRGADPRVREVLGAETYRSDVLAPAGLDDRSSPGGYFKKAERLMAAAVRADQAFFQPAAAPFRSTPPFGPSPPAREICSLAGMPIS